jgi:hypothetical protein
VGALRGSAGSRGAMGEQRGNIKESSGEQGSNGEEQWGSNKGINGEQRSNGGSSGGSSEGE